MPDPNAIPDGRDLIRTMGWVSLPYSCTGVVRKTAVSVSYTHLRAHET